MLARAREGECAEQTHVRGRTDESARADCADQAGAVCGTWCHKRRLERSAPTRRRRSLAQTRRRRDAAPLRPPLARGGEVVDGARPSVHGLGVVACECVRRTASEPSRAHAHLPRSTAGSRCAQVRCSTRALGGAERRRGVDAANGSARAGQMPLLARAKNGVGKPLALLVFFVLFVTNYAGSLNISISPSRLDAVSGSSYSEDGAASQLGGDDDLGQ
ncbi:hypothetical protein DFH06DRAFT_1217803 [Mycena polygramma]|nr:hypothetical protein DFH06DRAFT_1217803 [Mycena polygramma]